jgi:hypothetical protein
MHPRSWQEVGRVNKDDCVALTKAFSMEVDSATKTMNTNTAPGPDGFQVQFYKGFWDKVKILVKQMLDNMHAGRLDLGRLNYGVIIQIPEIKDANVIHQYRPICLLNVIFKIITAVLANRLTWVADKVVHSIQILPPIRNKCRTEHFVKKPSHFIRFEPALHKQQ